MVKVVTINILFEMEKWAQRRELLVEGLAAQQADLIGLQEVKLPEDNSAWLAQQLNINLAVFSSMSWVLLGSISRT